MGRSVSSEVLSHVFMAFSLTLQLERRLLLVEVEEDVLWVVQNKFASTSNLPIKWYHRTCRFGEPGN